MDDATTTTERQPLIALWDSRIVGTGAESPDDLLANPWNFKIHGGLQQEAATASLQTVGWVAPVIVNQATGHVLDGHMRVMLAARHRQPAVPVLYVNLSEDEERQALIFLYQTGVYASIDKRILRELLPMVDGLSSDPAVQRMLGDVAKLAKKELPLPPADDMENVEAGGLFGAGGVRPQASQERVTAPEPALSGRGNVALSERDHGPERRALSVVLTNQDYRRWVALRTALGAKTDTAAVVAILDMIESGELDLATERG